MAWDETVTQTTEGSLQFSPNQEDTENVRRIIKQPRIKITSSHYALFTVSTKQAHTTCTVKSLDLNQIERNQNWTTSSISKFKIS